MNQKRLDKEQLRMKKYLELYWYKQILAFCNLLF